MELIGDEQKFFTCIATNLEKYCYNYCSKYL